MTDSIAATDAAAPPRLAGGSVTPALRPPSARVFELPSPLPLRQCMPLVPGLPATSQRNLHLGPAVLEVEGQRHDREPALLDSPLDLVDLRAVQQQLALAAGGDIGPRRLGVLRDVHLVQPDLTVLHVGEPVDEGGAPGSQRLDLGADQDDACFPAVLEVVVVGCPSVAGDHELRLLTGHDTSLAVRPRAGPAGEAGLRRGWSPTGEGRSSVLEDLADPPASSMSRSVTTPRACVQTRNTVPSSRSSTTA